MKNVNFKVSLSYSVFENGNTYQAEYIVKAPDQFTAVNKATIKLLREYNPVKFIWNTCSEYTLSFKNHEPLCESFAGGY